MSASEVFDQEYKKLNKAQKEAVDSIDGPVMVVAGPGTGKTQILALRIGNILLKTDTKADGVLCLTFTNSAVDAMRERLVRYMGKAGGSVNIFTFHSFGMKMVEEHFRVLDLDTPPKLLEDTETIIIFDEILNTHNFEYLRPRSDSSRYFSDLKSLISLLKRERISAEDFTEAIKKEIKLIENDENNISSRGESKGRLKQETLKELESLTKTEEVSLFFKFYEEVKKERNLFDYDDVLESLVKIIEISKEALSMIRERYLYVLIDEHQDSSLVQNEFLKKVWGPLEKPDIFVVGDDRQLIYGFSGASIDHFKAFKKTFPEAKLITLVDNYRSTQIILDASHMLLKSVMSEEKLISQSKEHHPIRLIEAGDSEGEIFAAAEDIREKIKTGLPPNEVAILVPKNRQVRHAIQVLHQVGLPIASLESLNFFDQEEAQSLVRVLKIFTGDNVALAASFFDKTSEVDPILAHQFFAKRNMKEFSLEILMKETPSLFVDKNSVNLWLQKLIAWYKDVKERDLKTLISIISGELLKDNRKNLVTSKEITDTILDLLEPELERNSELTLSQFISYLEKIEAAAVEVPLVSPLKAGIQVLTMHSSKGREFEYVWIAHTDEHSLSGGKKLGFSLPRSIREVVEEGDIDAVKRKLFVALTRAKKFCTLSYSLEEDGERQRELAKIIDELPSEIFEKQKASTQGGPASLGKEKTSKEGSIFGELVKLVKDIYSDRYISASLLNNFFECPWKWYFMNLLKMPQDKSASLEFGNKVHEAIDQILKLNKIILPSDKEVSVVIERWIKNSFHEIAPNRESEKSISTRDEEFPHLNIYGKIDLIERLDEDSIRVTDFKTGGVRKKSDIEKMNEEGRMSNHLRQLAMYSYLLSNNSKTNVIESRLEFLEAKNEKERMYSRVITLEEIGLLVKDILDYDQLVKTGKWVNRPCNYNSYGKNTGCEYCKMAEIYSGK